MFELGTPPDLLDQGLRMADDGDLDGARDALSRALDSGDAEVVPRAAFALASLYQRSGNLSGALRLYELATRSPDPETAAAARAAVRSLDEVHTELTAEMSPAEIAFAEGVHLRAVGDLPAAVGAFRRCMATEDAEYAPCAGCQLGAILATEGDFENAKPPLWLAIRSGHPTYAPVSAYVLAEILLEQGDRAGARELLPLAARHPDPDTARRAATILDSIQARFPGPAR